MSTSQGNIIRTHWLPWLSFAVSVGSLWVNNERLKADRAKLAAAPEHAAAAPPVPDSGRYV